MFLKMLYDKKQKCGNAGNQLFNNKNHPQLTVTITRKLLTNYQFGI